MTDKKNVKKGTEELDKLLRAAKQTESLEPVTDLEDEEMELEEADFPTFDKMKKMASKYMKTGAKAELEEADEDEEAVEGEVEDDDDAELPPIDAETEAKPEGESAPVEGDEPEMAAPPAEDAPTDLPPQMPADDGEHVSDKEVDTILFDTETEEEADELAPARKKVEEAEVAAEGEEDEEDDELTDEKLEEHVKAMFNGVEVSEEFIKNAKTILEAVVKTEAKSMLRAKRAGIKKAMNEAISKRVVEIRKLHESTLDKYASYVAQEFINENKVALKSSIQSKLNESFMNGLKNLFEKHYVAVPENRKGVLSKMSDKVNKLTEENEKVTKLASKLNEQLANLKRDRIVEAACSGLTLMQSDKLRKLLENVEYKGEVDFINKAKVIRESYDTGSNQPETAKPLNETKEVVDPMDVYVQAISKSAKY